MLEKGTKAPDFTLCDKDGNEVSLSSFLGKKVVLYFYPRDNTPGCSRQACAFAGSFEEFKSEFNQNAAELFGAGWVWLACDHEGQLYIVQEPNGGNPVTHGLVPLLGIDVWEHAYYLDYHNRRSEHVEAVWGIVNWPIIEERYESIGVAENSCQTAVERLWEK